MDWNSSLLAKSGGCSRFGKLLPCASAGVLRQNPADVFRVEGNLPSPMPKAAVLIDGAYTFYHEALSALAPPDGGLRPWFRKHRFGF